MTWIVARAVKDKVGKKDASRVFIPESIFVAQALRRAGQSVVFCDLVGRPDPLWATIDGVEDLQGLVYLGHGLPLGLPSAGLRGRQAAWDLAQRIADKVPLAAPRGPRVTFFACSAADNPRRKGVSLDGPGTDGGFADEVRDELCRQGCSWSIVYAHATAGHASKNPFLAAFEGRGSNLGGQGGSAVVRAKGPLWRTWKVLMADPSDEPSLRHRLPMLTPDEVLSEVVASL